jgi:hypothetical protein
MSTGFNWFTTYEIKDHTDYWYEDYELHYIGGGSTSHSSGNIIKVQELLEKYCGKRIPQINRSWIDSVEYNLDLIAPSEMSNMCDKVLGTTEVDKLDMRSRFEWLKKLSDQGFYISYDFE